MTTPSELRECRDCGLRQSIPELEGGSVAHCQRCDAVLRRAARQAESFPLWCASTAALLYFVALFIPFMTVKAPGRESHATLFAGPEWLNERGVWPLAIVVFLTLIAMPALKLIGLVTVLFAVRLDPPPRWLGKAYRWTRSISPWAMTEVFLLGAFIAYTRLGQLAHVSIEPALYLLGSVMLCTVAAEGTLDEESIWDVAETTRESRAPRADSTPAEHGLMCHGCGRLEHAPPGSECSRCGAVVHARRPRSVEHTWALVASALLLYIPANVLPVMTVRRLGHGHPNTILSGVIELVEAHLIPLALLVFTASFVVPVVKLAGLVAMLIATHLRSGRWLRARTKLFRVIDVIGRWSMIDVFVLSTLVGLVHLGFLGSVTPGWGAVAFGGVVILTMVAAGSFDPRMMWDAAPNLDHRQTPALGHPMQERT